MVFGEQDRQDRIADQGVDDSRFAAFALTNAGHVEAAFRDSAGEIACFFPNLTTPKSSARRASRSRRPARSLAPSPASSGEQFAAIPELISSAAMPFTLVSADHSGVCT